MTIEDRSVLPIMGPAELAVRLKKYRTRRGANAKGTRRVSIIAICEHARVLPQPVFVLMARGESARQSKTSKLGQHAWRRLCRTVYLLECGQIELTVDGWIDHGAPRHALPIVQKVDILTGVVKTLPVGKLPQMPGFAQVFAGTVDKPVPPLLRKLL
jgi:hypothetical protein